MRILCLLCAAMLMLIGSGPFFAAPTFAQTYDAEAPCGRDDNGYPLQCARPDASADQEAACLTTGRLENCLPYHQVSCQVRGFQAACQLYALGSNCYGGDPNQCNFYLSLLQANRACALDNDQNACAFLRQNGY